MQKQKQKQMRNQRYLLPRSSSAHSPDLSTGKREREKGEAAQSREPKLAPWAGVKSTWTSTRCSEGVGSSTITQECHLFIRIGKGHCSEEGPRFTDARCCPSLSGITVLYLAGAVLSLANCTCTVPCSLVLQVARGSDI